MPEVAQSISLRAATPADQDFLLTVFASTRSDELAALALDAKQAEFFIRMQFNAQQQSYSACYPAAKNSIIFLADRSIGRILVDGTDDGLLLVDISILPEYRNLGIGTCLIRDLLTEAAAAGQAVRLHVFKSNRAVRLYQRLGFSTIADDGAYVEMNCSA